MSLIIRSGIIEEIKMMPDFTERIMLNTYREKYHV
jgi:hypothetical protein